MNHRSRVGTAYPSDYLDFGTNPFKNWSSLPFLGLLLLVESPFCLLEIPSFVDETLIF